MVWPCDEEDLVRAILGLSVEGRQCKGRPKVISDQVVRTDGALDEIGRTWWDRCDKGLRELDEFLQYGTLFTVPGFNKEAARNACRNTSLSYCACAAPVV